MSDQQRPSRTDFLSALASGYPPDPDLRLEIRCLSPGRSRGETRSSPVGPRQWYPLTVAGMTSAAADAGRWAARWDVYMGCLPRWLRGSHANDVPYCGWLWCDVDGGDAGPDGAFALVKQAMETGPKDKRLPAPTMAVVSGHGLHLYWRLPDCTPLGTDEERERLRQVLKRICLRIGGSLPGPHADPGCCFPNSLLRVPLTYNHKRDTVALVRLLRLEFEQPEAWTYFQWRCRLPPLPCPPPREPDPRRRPGQVPRIAVEWSHSAPSPGERHHDMVSMAAFLGRECGVAANVILDLLRSKQQQSGKAPDYPRELEDIAKWAVAS